MFLLASTLLCVTFMIDSVLVVNVVVTYIYVGDCFW